MKRLTVFLVCLLLILTPPRSAQKEACFSQVNVSQAKFSQACLSENRIATNEKQIALTFDDGPHPENTDRILALLARYGITATFFVIGQNIEYFPEAFLHLQEAGVELGNHTYSHPKLYQKNAVMLAEELRLCEEAMMQRGAEKPVLFRPPEGVRNAVVSAVSKERGYETVYWNLDTLDWTGASAKSIETAILSGVKDGSIILCHDYIVGGGHTVEALETVIPRLLSEGYRFVTVSELLGTNR
ncbi:MAG: polysaccharide deacetylase family protein [Clostridia bacterium]|nr:polysaccharide deacetylase family protein [Clostridia bacterium]